MATTYYTDIQKLYVAYFNRPADVAGLAYWESVIEKNGATPTPAAVAASLTAIAKEFANSAEYKASFAGMGAPAVVKQIYQNLFNRAPEEAGLNFWATDLAAGKITVDTIVRQVAESAQGTDKVIFANKVTAASSFTAQLDTQAEIDAYAKPASAASAKAFISSITTDASLAAAMVPQTLTNSVNTVLNAASVGTTQYMAMTADTITGTDGNDTFLARIMDNQNTFQSGDRIAGGAGIDRLEADVGNSQKFAITAETTSIEIAAFRAQTISTDATDNNMQTNEVQIDAERMVGVNQWESNNSRADLIVEDVRILNNQITKDITIAMVETDPGHVDFGVYFDQYSLRSQTNSTNVLRLQLMDTRSNAAGTGPLKDSPYNGFAFYYNGVLTEVRSTAIDAAQTYAELLAAITAAVRATPGLQNVVVALGGPFTVSDTLGSLQTGTEITLTSTAGDTINSSGPGAGWLAAGAVPPSSGLHTNMSTLANTSAELVTSKIILDDVGRGSTGGDLVVGGLSVGDTSESKGVQRFEIEVRDNSKLQHISSTNNTLREVTVVNGVTSNNSFAYVTTSKDKGDLTVLGNALGTTVNTGINTPLPGSAAQHGQFGFEDVRLIDASGFNGKFTFDAAITTKTIAKYINLVDFAANPSTDVIAFTYTGGTGDDSMDIAIDGAVAASNSLMVVGREDFTFTANGGLGNDQITLRMVDGFDVAGVVQNPGNTQNWYNNQVINANVSINAGEGDDVVRKPGAGNVVIDLGAGNDTVYTDNSGFQLAARDAAPIAGTNMVAGVNAGRATYVFNAADGDAVTAGIQYNYFDLRSQAAASISAVNAQLTVNFHGITKTVAIANSMNSLTNVTISDLQVNQAIKDAINNDVVLNKLLIAEDGPGRTLIVRSLIDGAHTVADLAVTFSTVALSAAQAAVLPALVPFTVGVTGYTAWADGYATNFVQYNGTGSAATAAVPAVVEVKEVQTIDLSAEPVANLGTLTFTIDGVAHTYTNNSGGPLNSAALVANIVANAPATAAGLYGFTQNAVTSTLTITQQAPGKDIAAITAVNSTPDGSVPVSVETTKGVAAAAAVPAAVGVNEVIGADSTSTSDNNITGGAGNDVIVLGSTIGATAVASSNEVVKYAAGPFGNDTVVYFDVAGFGIDQFDFTALGGRGVAFGGALTTDKSINVVAETTANDTIAEIAAFYTDSTTAQTHVYIANDATTNIAKVYTVVDAAGVGTGSVVVTLVGSIDLADTLWTSVTGANFV